MGAFKLSPAQRESIRSAPKSVTTPALAKEFGISKWYCWMVRTGRIEEHQQERQRRRQQFTRPLGHSSEGRRCGEGRDIRCATCHELYRFEFNQLIGQTFERCRCGLRLITPEVARLRWVPPVGCRAAILFMVIVCGAITACSPPNAPIPLETKWRCFMPDGTLSDWLDQPDGIHICFKSTTNIQVDGGTAK